MRTINIFLLLSTTILLSLCKSQNYLDSIEYWKIPTLKQYNNSLYIKIIDDYCNNNFMQMNGNDKNTIEADYLIVAKLALHLISFNELSQNYNNEFSYNYFMDHVANNNDITKDLSIDSKANLESNPQVWWQNVNKIIGNIDDLKTELRSHVSIENKQVAKEAGHMGYNIIYNIDDSMYVICIIVLKNNGGSEIQWIANNTSLIRILEYWTYED